MSGKNLPPEEIALTELSASILALFTLRANGTPGLDDTLRRLIRAHEELMNAHPKLPSQELHLPGFYTGASAKKRDR